MTSFNVLRGDGGGGGRAVSIAVDWHSARSAWEQTYASVAAALDAGVRHVVSLLVGYEKGKEKM